MRYKDMDVYKRIQIALNEYVDMPRSSLILDGREGLPLLEDALTVASRILDTSLERLQYHPDYLYIESEKTLGVEESTEIIAKAKLVPSLSNHTVVVINHFETMTPQAQNKLLKLIEDNAQILVLGIVLTVAAIGILRKFILAKEE